MRPHLPRLLGAVLGLLRLHEPRLGAGGLRLPGLRRGVRPLRRRVRQAPGRALQALRGRLPPLRGGVSQDGGVRRDCVGPPTAETTRGTNMADQPKPPADSRDVSREQLAGLLNEDLAREYQAIIAYVIYSQVLKGARYMQIAEE